MEFKQHHPHPGGSTRTGQTHLNRVEHLTNWVAYHISSSFFKMVSRFKLSSDLINRFTLLFWSNAHVTNACALQLTTTHNDTLPCIVVHWYKNIVWKPLFGALCCLTKHINAPQQCETSRNDQTFCAQMQSNIDLDKCKTFVQKFTHKDLQTFYSARCFILLLSSN